MGLRYKVGALVAVSGPQEATGSPVVSTENRECPWGCWLDSWALGDSQACTVRVKRVQCPLAIVGPPVSRRDISSSVIGHMIVYFLSLVIIWFYTILSLLVELSNA